MSLFLRLGASAAVIATAALFSALTTGSANAYEFCRRDVTAFMTSCSFSSMEQCQAMSAGRGGDCFRDPWLPNKEASNPANAYAQAPKPARKVKSSAQ